MSLGYESLVGKVVDGVFPLRGMLNAANICENDDKVTEVVSMAFYTYNDKCDKDVSCSPTFKFGVTKNGSVTEEYYIKIFQKEKHVGVLYLKPYLYKNTNLLYLELDATKTIKAN